MRFSSIIYGRQEAKRWDATGCLYIIIRYKGDAVMINSGIKRGTAEFAILNVLEKGPVHGYEIARQIEQRTKGALRFTLASLYPVLYKLEALSCARGRWQASLSGRRRRCYHLTARGRKRLAPLRLEWVNLFRALRRLRSVADA
jgi:PadR family transcriptional regulator, regulatory protein PadR